MSTLHGDDLAPEQRKHYLAKLDEQELKIAVSIAVLKRYLGDTDKGFVYAGYDPTAASGRSCRWLSLDDARDALADGPLAVMLPAIEATDPATHVAVLVFTAEPGPGGTPDSVLVGLTLPPVDSDETKAMISVYERFEREILPGQGGAL